MTALSRRLEWSSYCGGSSWRDEAAGSLSICPGSVFGRIGSGIGVRGCLQCGCEEGREIYLAIEGGAVKGRRLGGEQR